MSQSNKDSKFSKVLKNLANLSQIVLVIVACYGYFYTVRPVYQKALLEEAIAKKEIELREQVNSISKIKTEKDSLQKESKILTLKNRELYLINKELQNKEKLMKKELRIKFINYFLKHILELTPGHPGEEYHIRNNIAWVRTCQRRLKAFNITAETIIITGLSSFKEMSLMDDEEKENLRSCVSNYIQSNQLEMKKTFNFDELISDYEESYNRAQVMITPEKDSKITGFEYMAKQQAYITSEKNKAAHVEIDRFYKAMESINNITLRAVNDISEAFIKNGNCSNFK